jgi:precorrin-2/cobalt-factor-2 C20-methyltransferase
VGGIFYGIGVGPGNPDLLTLKAIRAIETADVIIAPKTEKKDGSVALSIARPYLKRNVEIVYQVFPMVTGFADSSEAWETNKREILALLSAGKNTAFLTIGDPMFYSTYIYIYRLLAKEDIEIETIPGIPAFCAIASRFGYPLVEGNDVLTIIPATATEEKIKGALAVADNVVMMKVYKNFSDMAGVLEEHNMAEQAIMVSRCGLVNEECINDIMAQKDKRVNYLSTIITRKSKGE